MNSATAPAPAVSQLVELDRDDCLRLLATGTVGRVLVSEGALPAAHPVVYLLDGEEIVFRTASASKLVANARHKVVGFQADDIDTGSRTGWSVLGVGEADEIVDPVRLAELAERLPAPWLRDGTARVMTIPLQRLTGRRLR